MEKLEQNLNKLFTRLNFFWMKLHPHRLFDGTYISGEPFDYIIIREGKTICFDAKECNSNALYASKIPVHQFNDLLKAEKNGAFVFFLIHFKKQNKICFIHPNTILTDGVATPNSIQVDCFIKDWIKK
ncbi:MAG: hypothetical protein EOM21_19035 [Gammaproteobacteria bacterium]|nr:hypothetical protein [Gammaproteobacteria bacterium]